MHIVGIWRPKKDSVWPYTFTCYEDLHLAFDKHVEKLENDQATVLYQGTIFDRSPDDLLNVQSALDSAFGLYTYVKIHKNRQEITIGTDRLGFSPLYYSLRGESLYFSTSATLLKYLLGDVTPNYEAWEELLNLSTILGDKTTMREISRLAAGTRIHLSREKITFNKYWSPEIPEKGEKKNFIKQNNELFFEALEYTRKVDLHKVVLLSGGHDSRRIAQGVRQFELNANLVTQEAGIGTGTDQDVLVAQEVSEILGMPFMRIPFPDKETFFNNCLIRDYWLAYETHYHEWMIPLFRKIPAKSLIYDGIIGDVTITSGWARIYPDRYKTTDIDKIARSIAEESRPFKFDTTKLDSPLFERVRGQLRELPNCPALVDYFYIMNRARRNISLGAQLESLTGHKTCFPFLYYPLFMQSLSLDPFQKTDVFYQLECMRAIDQKVAQIPTTRGVLSDKYLIDRSQQKKEVDHLLYRHVTIRSDLVDLLPQLYLPIKVLRFSSMIGLKTILKRLDWYIKPLHRISSFGDWVADVDSPDFPADLDQPTFLSDRFVS